MKESFAPEAIFMKEEQKVLKIDFMIYDTIGEIDVHEMKDIDLSFRYWLR